MGGRILQGLSKGTAEVNNIGDENFLIAGLFSAIGFFCSEAADERIGDPDR